MAPSAQQPQQVVKVPAPSASPLYNNLCALGGGAAFVHKRQVVILPSLAAGAEAAPQARRVDVPNAASIQSVCACCVGAAALVALGGDAGVQVWDEAGASLLYSWPLPPRAAAAAAAAAAPPPSCADFVRGLAFNAAAAPLGNSGAAAAAAQLCAGTSRGEVHVFDISFPGGSAGAGGGNPPFFQWAAALEGAHASPVTALGSAFQSRRGLGPGARGGGGVVGAQLGPGEGRELVSAGEGGAIAVWAPRGDKGAVYEKALGIGGSGGGSGGAAVVGVAVRCGLLVAGRADGAVHGYAMRDGAPLWEIQAHSRWLAALDMHPSRDVIASVSEDSTVGVWRLPSCQLSRSNSGAGTAAAASAAQGLAPLLSAAALGCCLTGVAFCGERDDDVAAVAVDGEEVLIWRGAAAAGALAVGR